jgi:hypothetical protein
LKYFIALSFSQKSLQFPKIQALQKRFDQNPLKPLSLEMELLPCFNLDSQMNETQASELWEEMSEQLEAQWLGVENAGLVAFNLLEFSSGKKGHDLFLKANLSDDFFHAQEALQESLKAAGAFFKKTKGDRKIPEKAFESWLVLGHFHAPEVLESALQFSQQEIQLPLYLLAQGLDLYETRPNGQSFLVRNLFTFAPTKDKISLEQYHFAGQ